MTDSQSIMAEGSHAPKLASIPSLAPTPNLSREDTGSSQGCERYEPLPPGCWTLDFHGNCPRCHHHNRALQVQVKVTPDAQQVSYVHCERCQDRWAAFGGRNSTRISLLSATTTEPDPVARGVRYSLIDIVNLATGKVPLGTLPESSSPVPSRHPSVKAYAPSNPPAPSSYPRVSESVKDAEFFPIPTSQSHQHLKVTTCDVTDHARPATIRGNALQLISILKTKVTKRFPMMHRINMKQKIRFIKPREMSKRQFEKSPIGTPPIGDLDIVPAGLSDPAVKRQGIYADRKASVSADFQNKVVEPSKRIAEVVAFVASLEKSKLKSMSEEERIEWMRKEYTAFKARKTKPLVPLSMSAIVHESIPTELPTSPPRTLDRLSMEMLGIGAHVELLDSLEAALYRGSIAISETTSEAPSAPDENTIVLSPCNPGQHLVQRLRQGLGRPQSLPNTLSSSSHLRPTIRHSFDALVPGRGSSTWSTRGQLTSRFSQVSTLNSSTSSVDQFVSPDILHLAENHEESGMDSLMPSPPSQSTP
jgi:hypothetical protein